MRGDALGEHSVPVDGWVFERVRAQLRDALLVSTQLQGADLSNAELHFAFLVKAQLQGARLINAELQGADLTGAQLQDTILNIAWASKLRPHAGQRGGITGALRRPGSKFIGLSGSLISEEAHYGSLIFGEVDIRSPDEPAPPDEERP